MYRLVSMHPNVNIGFTRRFYDIKSALVSGGPMQSLSSNSFSFEIQVRDVLRYCKQHLPELWHDLIWRATEDDWDDSEWYMILCDHLEDKGPFRWWENEPWLIDVDEFGYCVDVDWLNVVWEGNVPQWLLDELVEAGHVTAGF